MSEEEAQALGRARPEVANNKVLLLLSIQSSIELYWSLTSVSRKCSVILRYEYIIHLYIVPPRVSSSGYVFDYYHLTDVLAKPLQPL